MTRFCVFTPTRLPGIDVSLASIERQILDPGDEVLWVIADEIDREFHANNSQVITKRICVPWDVGNPRNLARAYNYGIREARDWGADIFVSMQDYIWAPENGLQLFAQVDRAMTNIGTSKTLLTGYCDISADPSPDLITNPGGWITIFDEPYEDQPQDIAWYDSRRENKKGAEEICQIPALEWETNWAAISKVALYDEELFYDEEFDAAVAYENQAFSYLAKQKGYIILLDQRNEAISLPHKRYFSQWEKEEAPLTHINRKLTEDRYAS